METHIFLSFRKLVFWSLGGILLFLLVLQVSVKELYGETKSKKSLAVSAEDSPKEMVDKKVPDKGKKAGKKARKKNKKGADKRQKSEVEDGKFSGQDKKEKNGKRKEKKKKKLKKNKEG